MLQEKAEVDKKTNELWEEIIGLEHQCHDEAQLIVPALVNLRKEYKDLQLKYDVLRAKSMAAKVEAEKEGEAFGAGLDNAVAEELFQQHLIIARGMTEDGLAAANQLAAIQRLAYQIAMDEKKQQK